MIRWLLQWISIEIANALICAFRAVARSKRIRNAQTALMLVFEGFRRAERIIVIKKRIFEISFVWSHSTSLS